VGAQMKASGIVNTRKLLRELGTAAETAVLEQLAPDDAKIYRETMPINWVPVESVTRILVAAAPVVCAEHPQPIHELGRRLANIELTGLYKVLIRMTTVDFMISQAAKIWGTYHQQGEALALKSSEHEAVFTVKNYPELPERYREMLCGYLQGMVELTGAKLIRVKRDDQPAEWRWIVSYT